MRPSNRFYRIDHTKLSFRSGQCNYAIRLASENGQLEVVKLLLSGSRVDLTVHDNYAIKSASYNNHMEFVKLLIPRCDLSTITDVKILDSAKTIMVPDEDSTSLEEIVNEMKLKKISKENLISSIFIYYQIKKLKNKMLRYIALYIMDYITPNAQKLPRRNST